MKSVQGSNRRPSSVYLHYLDRELNEAAAGSSLDEERVIRATRILALMTGAQLYCGLSAIWESESLGPRGLREVEVLLAFDQLDTVSHNLTLPEFLDRRREAYEYDRERYPRYFGPPDDYLQWAKPTMRKLTGSSVPLAGHIAQWAQDDAGASGPLVPAVIRVKGPVRVALSERENEALTWSFFSTRIGELASVPIAQGEVRRQISRGFTQDYQRFGSGDIATGERALRAFDSMAREFPFADLRLLAELAAVAGLSDVLNSETTGTDRWAEFVGQRDQQAHQELTNRVEWIVAALLQRERSRTPNASEDADDFYSQESLSLRMRQMLQRAIPLRVRSACRADAPPDEVLRSAALALEMGAQRLGREDPIMLANLDSTRSLIVETHADVVVLTTTEVETTAFEAAMDAAGVVRQPTRYGDVNTYSLYGPVGGIVLGHVRCTMGSSSAGASTLTVADAIRELAPWAVLAVGIAFGVDEKKQEIGRVLLSERLTPYELQRVGEVDGKLVVLARGGSQTASPTLLGRFRDSHMNEVGITLEPGEMLSGEKLLDNAEFKGALLDRYPDAIGGEMEGTGVLAASTRGGVDWLVIKAVCDYAQGKAKNKKHRQQVAATNAMAAFMFVLQDGGLKRPRGK